ncbi:MAG: hypothetical protein BJ554DRAFT_3611, partial [Olpidium bornovanus]
MTRNSTPTSPVASAAGPTILQTKADYQMAIRQLEARLAEVMAQRDHLLQATFAATTAAEDSARKPSEFNGANRTPHHVRNFLAQFEQYADYARINSSARVAAVGALLADEAAAWFQSLAGSMSNFTEFRCLFFCRWGDPLEEENVRRRLASIQQTGSAHLYTEEFSRIALLLPDLTESDKFFAYKLGLSDGLQRNLRVMSVASLEDAISTSGSPPGAMVTLAVFKKMLAMGERLTGKRLLVRRTDRGGEYM